MLFANSVPDWLVWVIGVGGPTMGGAIVWVVKLIGGWKAANRVQEQEDKKSARDLKLEDESRAIQHLEHAVKTLKEDNTDLRKQIVDMKLEMKTMQLETAKAQADAQMQARKAGEVATQNQMRADRFHMYCLYLEDTLSRNKIGFRQWREDEDASGTHPALPGVTHDSG